MSECIRLAIMMCTLVAIAACARSMTEADAPQAPEFSTLEERHEWIVSRFLPWMEEYGWSYDSVPRADGRLLSEIVEKTNRRRALELGSGNGYSAIWIGLGMEKTGGSLITIEIDRDKAGLCQRNVDRAGLGNTVTCVRGDALAATAGLEGRFDFLLVDVGPTDVLPFIKAVEGRLADSHIIVLHNVGFGGSYTRFLGYARAKGWFVETVKPKGGYGLFLISPQPLDVEVM